MAVAKLDFYEPDGETLVGTLDDSQLIECEVRPALMELGALRFVVSRHLAAASSALLAKGNIVKVTYPLVDPDPIAVFVLKDDVAYLIDKDEQGGETIEVTGPGALWLLQHARLREEVYAPGQPARGDWSSDISWNWRGRAYGAILVRCFEEGQYQPGAPFQALTLDFSREADSDGVPWYVIAEDFSVPIGTDVLDVAQKIAAAGDLILVLTPDLVLHAYQTYGRDLTGAFAADNVRFEKDVNILTELQRKTKLDRVTHLITRDMDAVYRVYVTPDAYDQAVYGFLDINWTNDEPQIEKTALNTLAASDSAQETYALEHLPGERPAEGEYLAGPEGTSGHYWPGDSVTLHTGSGTHDLNAAVATIAAVSIVIDVASDDADATRQARSLHLVPELVIGAIAPNLSGVGSGSNAGGPGCICPKPCQPMTSGIPVLVDAASSETPDGASKHIGDPFHIPTGLSNPMLIIAVSKTHTFVPFPNTAPPVWDPDVGATQASTLYDYFESGVSSGLALYYLANPTPGDGEFRCDNASSFIGGWLLENVNQTDPVAAWAEATGSGLSCSVSLPSVADGVYLNAAATDDDDFALDAPGTAVPVAGNIQDWSDAWELGGPGFRDRLFAGGHGDSSPGWNFDQSHPWSAFVVRINGLGGVAGAGRVELIGVSKDYKRCDDTEHYHTTGAPTVNHDASQGFRVGTFWINEDGELWTLTDATNGAAVWWSIGLTLAEVEAAIADAIADHLIDAVHATTAGALTTRYEPHTDYDGHVIVNGSGDPVMVEVAD